MRLRDPILLSTVLVLLTTVPVIPLCLAAPAKPVATATPRASGCQGRISTRLSTQTAICRTVAITTELEPTCPVCPEGINVVYVQNYGSPGGDRWLATAPRQSLTLLERLQRSDVQVGVIRYFETCWQRQDRSGSTDGR